MGIIQHKQTGVDGIGQPKTLTGMSTIRLKAKQISTAKNTTLKVTGNTTGTTWTIDVIVQSGTPTGTLIPPSVDPGPPAGPTAGFTFYIN
jgi:hypothetical protein